MQKIGKLIWSDLTVDNAEKIRNFYCSVVGWTFADQSMGNYSDYNIISPEDNEVVTGICHQKGVNSKLPPQWINYVTVASLEQALEKCKLLGGTVIDGPRNMGQSDFAVIMDPAGAFLGLIAEKPEAGKPD